MIAYAHLLISMFHGIFTLIIEIMRTKTVNSKFNF